MIGLYKKLDAIIDYSWRAFNIFYKNTPKNINKIICIFRFSIYVILLSLSNILVQVLFFTLSFVG